MSNRRPMSLRQRQQPYYRLSVDIGSGKSRRMAAPRATADTIIWTAIIVFLVMLASLCWWGSFYIFGHPEKPLSYSVLKQFRKIESPMRFTVTTAPQGTFFTPDKLLQMYEDMPDADMQEANSKLLRNFLRNYKLTDSPVQYIVGEFDVLDSYDLKPGQFMESGVIMLAASRKTPKVFIEQLYPANAKAIPYLQRAMLTGLEVEMKPRLDFSVIIHVKRLGDGRIQFTTVPITYGNYTTTATTAIFSLDPPKSFNVAALPVLDGSAVAAAVEKFQSWQKRNATGKNPQVHSAQLIRIEKAAKLDKDDKDDTAANEEMTTDLATPTPAPAAAASPTPEPTHEPTPTPTPEPIVVTADDAKSWPLYAPGRMPNGLLVTAEDAAAISSISPSKRHYIQGKFTVSIVSENRAVLIPALPSHGGFLGIGGKKANIRVVVEYPTTLQPPAVGGRIQRNAQSPFLLTDVKKDLSTGAITLFVREIILQN